MRGNDNINPNQLLAIGAFLTLVAAFLSFVSSLVILKQGNDQQVALEETLQDIEDKLAEIRRIHKKQPTSLFHKN